MEEYKEWFHKAKSDFDTAKYNLKGNKLDAGLFFLQQSAEKALKAVYIKVNKKIFKTHDLVILARSLSSPEKIIKHCTILSPFYQQTRYPDVPSEKYDSYDEFILATEEVLIWAESQLR